jgi:hypothetical protein
MNMQHECYYVFHMHELQCFFSIVLCNATHLGIFMICSRMYDTLKPRYAAELYFCSISHIISEN